MAMLRLLAVLMLLLAPTSPALARTASSRLEANPEAYWVPFVLTPGNQIRFAMRIGGADASAILDTGISVTVVSPDFARRAGLRGVPMRGVMAIGGKVAARWSAVSGVQLGGLSQKGGGVLIAALPGTATRGGQVDALAGHDLFGGYALDIDYEHRRFRLLPSGSLPFTGASAPLTIATRWRSYTTEIVVAGRRIAPIHVDTGDGTSLTLTRPIFAALPLAAPVTTTIDFGVGGGVVSELSLLPSVMIAGQVARDVPTRAEPPGGFAESIGMAGRMGSELLSRYRVLLDPRAGRMMLGPRATPAPPPLRSTSGMLFALDGARLKLIHVMRGGPAAKAGWQAGTLICTVDGAPIPPDYDDTPFGRWSVGAPGRVVTLGLCDGTERRLTLARFY